MNRRKQVLFSTLIIYERSEFWKFFVLLLTLLSIEKTLKLYIKSSKLHCIYQDLHFKQAIANLVTYLFSIWRYFEKTKVCKIVSPFPPLHLIEKCYFSSSRKVSKGCNWVINIWWVKISSCNLLNLAQGEPNHQRKNKTLWTPCFSGAHPLFVENWEIGWETILLGDWASCISDL